MNKLNELIREIEQKIKSLPTANDYDLGQASALGIMYGKLREIAGWRNYECTDCKKSSMKINNNKITVGMCDHCGHPLWNDDKDIQTDVVAPIGYLMDGRYYSAENFKGQTGHIHMVIIPLYQQQYNDPKKEGGSDDIPDFYCGDCKQPLTLSKTKSK